LRRGTNSKGSGLQIDVRKDHPYAAYKELSFEIPVRSEGDVMAKTVVRLQELLQSVEIVEQAVSSLPGGDMSRVQGGSTWRGYRAGGGT
jgi:NADH:ubiquinone oxidoreductase subunit D